MNLIVGKTYIFNNPGSSFHGQKCVVIRIDLRWAQMKLIDTNYLHPGNWLHTRFIPVPFASMKQSIKSLFR